MAASCDAPAKTIEENPMAASVPSPSAAGLAPATSPKGITPTSIGATALAPARKSADGTGRSCPTPAEPPNRFSAQS